MSLFESCFGIREEVVGRAPGRVNLIGEHTDYNDGLVLPVVIPQQTEVRLAAVGSRAVRVFTADPMLEQQTYELAGEMPRHDWIDYIQGVTRALRVDGYEISGFDALITSRVPMGSGVSSSAALTVALQRALRERYALPLDDVELALLAQRAENEFVGARVGAMDPMVASLGRPDHALFLDLKDLSFRHVPIPRSIELVVVDSGQRHAHAEGGYNQRRAECELAADILGVAKLRDVASDDADVEALPEKLRRRVRHVLSENARVTEAVEALERDNPVRLGELFDDSHRSLRDDYEVSTEELDTLVATFRGVPGVYGARMTGGGFGGAVVAAVRRGAAEDIGRIVVDSYQSTTGASGSLLVPDLGARNLQRVVGRG
jgi:galactokinase